MSKVNYDDVWDEDPFHPCLKCGGYETTLNRVTTLYSCAMCGEALVAPRKSTKVKTPKPPQKKFRLDDDWE